MAEPRTEAGRRLLEELSENPLNGARYAHHVVSLRLPAIEAEAAALDVERVAEALGAVEGFPNNPSLRNREVALYIVGRVSEPSEPMIEYAP